MRLRGVSPTSKTSNDVHRYPINSRGAGNLGGPTPVVEARMMQKMSGKPTDIPPSHPPTAAALRSASRLSPAATWTWRNRTRWRAQGAPGSAEGEARGAREGAQGRPSVQGPVEPGELAPETPAAPERRSARGAAARQESEPLAAPGAVESRGATAGRRTVLRRWR